MKNKAKLAFEMLEKEMEVIEREELRNFTGGTGPITWSPEGWVTHELASFLHTTVTSGIDQQGNWVVKIGNQDPVPLTYNLGEVEVTNGVVHTPAGKIFEGWTDMFPSSTNNNNSNTSSGTSSGANSESFFLFGNYVETPLWTSFWSNYNADPVYDDEYLTGYNSMGYNSMGYNSFGYNSAGLDSSGYDHDGYNSAGNPNFNTLISSLSDADVVQSISQINYGNTPFAAEMAFSILVDPITHNITTSTLQVGDSNGVMSTVYSNAQAVVHIHTTNNWGPSIADIYSLAIRSINNPNLGASYALTPNGNMYALIIEDRGIIDVVNNSSLSSLATDYDPATGGFKEGSPSYNSFWQEKSALVNMGYSSDDAYNMATARVLAGSGIVLYKKDGVPNSTDSFQKINHL